MRTVFKRLRNGSRYKVTWCDIEPCWPRSQLSRCSVSWCQIESGDSDHQALARRGAEPTHTVTNNKNLVNHTYSYTFWDLNGIALISTRFLRIYSATGFLTNKIVKFSISFSLLSQMVKTPLDSGTTTIGRIPPGRWCPRKWWPDGSDRNRKWCFDIIMWN